LLLLAWHGAHAYHGRVLEADRPAAASAAAADIGGHNWDGTPFRLSAQRGKVAVVFFGYTSCPDVCPSTLAAMKQLQRNLGERAKDVAIVFVSVDPERDTVMRLGGYVPAFDARFYGVRTDEDALRAITAAYGVTVVKHAPTGARGAYAVDHTGLLFIVDRQGRLRLTFAPELGVDKLREDVEQLLREQI
jgi:protein SCO1/2